MNSLSKIIISTLFFVGFFFISNAQLVRGFKGVKGGSNLSYMSSKVENSPMFTYNLGVYADIKMLFAGISAEALISGKGAALKNPLINQKRVFLNYLDIPITYKLYLFPYSDQISIGMGLQPSFLLFSNLRGNNDGRFLEISPLVAFGWEATKESPWSYSLRYIYGLNNAAILENEGKLKNRAVQFSVGYALGE